MNEVCAAATDLANQIFQSASLDLRATSSEVESGCYLSIAGEDSGLLLGHGGELLDAIQHLLAQAFGRKLAKGQRIVCDADNFRGAREAELHAMAEHAAQQVRSTRTAFIFGPMEANERRLIHLALAGEADLQTESIGEGNARRLKVSLKPPVQPDA
jgi:spoIIIJ-associated protein